MSYLQPGLVFRCSSGHGVTPYVGLSAVELTRYGTGRSAGTGLPNPFHTA